MSEIQDQAYTEACQEIEQLKFLNAEECKTIEELSRLCLRAADALESWMNSFAKSGESNWTTENIRLIAELRKAAE